MWGSALVPARERGLEGGKGSDPREKSRSYLTGHIRFCLGNYKGRLVCTNGVQSLPFYLFWAFSARTESQPLASSGEPGTKGECRVANPLHRQLLIGSEVSVT